MIYLYEVNLAVLGERRPQSGSRKLPSATIETDARRALTPAGLCRPQPHTASYRGRRQGREHTGRATGCRGNTELNTGTVTG